MILKERNDYLDFIADEALVRENRFLSATPDRSRVPILAEKRHLLPEPVWPARPDAIDCYWKTWDLAFRNLGAAKPHNDFVHPYIDTAFNDCLFMWDSVFILHFARYGSRAFPFQGTLDNFYAKQRAIRPPPPEHSIISTRG